MIKSIQQFGENGISSLEKVISNFVVEPKNHAEFIYGVTDQMIKFGLSIIAEIFEQMDDAICKDNFRRKKWSIVKSDSTTLLTSLGNVSYKKTLFINKETKERVYLLDELMRIEKHARMTEDAEARILEEAVESSYRKGGNNASLTERVSKQTVKNKVHKLCFPPEAKEAMEKKKVRYLYINADEDHVAAQFFEKKGDIKKQEGRKFNTFMPKLVYVYEDLVPESESEKVLKKRYKLKNPHYFGGMYEGKENATLWKEVESYIEANYDIDYLEKVYLCGDGASWIKAGCDYVDKSVFVLDLFHRNKYINESVSHLLDSKSDARDRITDCFSLEDKKGFRGVYNSLRELAETDSKKESIENAKQYLLNNWDGIIIYYHDKSNIKGCNAEGHVSHVYSSRMSSRPLGWSKTGTDKMSRLRIYYYNGGNMLDLIRKQEKELPKAAGIEELSCSSVMQTEHQAHREIEKYFDVMQHTLVGSQVRKIAAIKGHIWNL